MLFLDNIYLIPLLPAIGAAIMFFFGRRLQKQTVSAVCVGSVALAFLIACGAVWQYTQTYAPAHDHQPFEKVLYTWLGTDTGHMNYLKSDGIAGCVPCGRRISARSALEHLAAVCNRRRDADPYLFDRVHGA